MIAMKRHYIILIFLFVSAKGFSQQFDVESFLLDECEITDTMFLNGISALVLSDSVYFNDKEKYVFYLSFDSTKFAFGSNYIVILMPIMESSIVNSTGIFCVKNKKILIDSSVPPDIFIYTGKKEEVFYRKTRHHAKKNRRLITECIEEFSVWFLNYSDGIMSVTNKLYVN
jgi:hypothetical protein